MQQKEITHLREAAAPHIRYSAHNCTHLPQFVLRVLGFF